MQCPAYDASPVLHTASVATKYGGILESVLVALAKSVTPYDMMVALQPACDGTFTPHGYCQVVSRGLNAM